MTTPFLVIEPTKTEYRILKTLRDHKDKSIRLLAENVQIWTPGNEFISPMRYNPLVIEEGIYPDEHIENLLCCFAAAFPVAGPLPLFLREALEEVYEEYEKPVMADLAVVSRRIIQKKDYSCETKSDFMTASDVRLGSLTRGAIGKVLQCRENIPEVSQLMRTPTIIELDRLPIDQANLFTLFLLTAVREYVKTTFVPNRGLQQVTVIEEAHNIVGCNTKAAPSEIAADPKAYSAEYICRMLAELRAYGVGIVIVDQLPSTVAPQVIKNTGSKLAFRQVANDDRKELGGAMLFGQTEHEEIARLQAGEAYFFTEGYHGPRRIRAVNPYE